MKFDIKPIRIFRHIACEGPGHFADILAHYNIPYQLVRIDKGETPPPQIDDVSGLVFMGGPMSVNDDLPWIAQEMQLIRNAVDIGLPVLGHCLGGQLISRALGGTIRANPVKELGWFIVEKTAGDAANDWLAALPQQNLMFHWHGETFSIPPGAQAILHSEHCRHQGFVIGNTLALQCHVEMTADMVKEWAERYEEELREPSATVQSRTEMTTELGRKIDELQQAADVLYRRWLRPILAQRDARKD